MKTHTFKHYSVVDRDDDQVEILCEMEYCPGEKGSTDGPHGPKLEPDVPAHVEMVDWTPGIDLTKEEIKRVEQEAWESV